MSQVWTEGIYLFDSYSRRPTIFSFSPPPIINPRWPRHWGQPLCSEQSCRVRKIQSGDRCV